MPHRDRYISYLNPPAVLIPKLKPDTPLLVYRAYPRGAGGGEFEFQMTAAATRRICGASPLKDNTLRLFRIEPLQSCFFFCASAPGRHRQDVFRPVSQWKPGPR